MLNLESIDKVYLTCGFTDLRKSIDGLVLEVQNGFKLNSFKKALFKRTLPNKYYKTLGTSKVL